LKHRVDEAIAGFAIDDFGANGSPMNSQPVDLPGRKLDYCPQQNSPYYSTSWSSSPNFPPEELMDPAQLRRVHYKMQIQPPTEQEFREIFQRICDSYGLEFNDEIMSYLLNSFIISTKFHLWFIQNLRGACFWRQLSRYAAADHDRIAD
jgi:hypothetical protein